ncbi:VOC family protein [Sutcliffiella sp. NC1]|uniref:VOC family protein n=1 Tax=Sutcliffiella sp. NC1 TaxID=3004096 RepID=UPI0022DD0439|nr:VOC family protein [Sutcliffiella sp. NC1]WBL17561.1 VOC family protein [Sutcliffiella sp. NC1]
MKEKWNERLPVHQLRIARPTDKWEEVNSFYGDEGLGLRRIGGFNKNGYEGVMYGLPSFGVHLEFTRHVNGSPCPAPTEDNLLVLYLSDHEKIDEMIERLNKLGAYEVPPVNPYWDKQAHTFEDPDGWRVVLCHSSGI